MGWNHLCNFSREHYEEHLCEINFEFGPVVQVKMLFKGISYLQLRVSRFFAAIWIHLCNFGRGRYEEHFCEIILI